MPGRISLCLIARDEETFLPACLASAHAHVDEIIVADTGSRDGTAAVARAAGARVVEHAWSDDFAAARNAVLAHASGDFVLVLDADERLHAPAGFDLRAQVAVAAWDCGLLPLYEASRLDEAPADVMARRPEAVFLPRLLRRTPDLYWEGVVHEHVARWLEGRRAARLDLPIVHYGSVAEVRATRHKADRNVTLLGQRIERDPADLNARVYLAEELWRERRLDDARPVIEDVWRRMEARPDAAYPGLWGHAATVRALLRLAAGDIAGAGTTVAAALVRQRPESAHPNLLFLHGLVAERRAQAAEGDPERRRRLEEAALSYEAALSMGEAPILEARIDGVSSWRSLGRLGVARLQLGDPGGALSAFEQGMRALPGDATCRLGRAEALLDLGRPDEALRALEPFPKPLGADTWIIAAAIGRALGRPDSAARFLSLARSAAASGVAEHHRLRRLEALLAAADAGAP